jgi:hypothetical protein
VKNKIGFLKELIVYYYMICNVFSPTFFQSIFQRAHSCLKVPDSATIVAAVAVVAVAVAAAATAAAIR